MKKLALLSPQKNLRNKGLIKFMQTVIIASENPVKINAVKGAFHKVFPNIPFTFIGVDVPSNVSPQPRSEKECIQGANNRVENCKNTVPNADFWVGIEAGIERQNSEMASFSWTIIHSTEGLTGKATTGISYLPETIVELIDSGKELGEAMDIVFGEHDSKQNNGAVGLLTGNAITRQKIHEVAVILALIPFKHPHLYHRH